MVVYNCSLASIHPQFAQFFYVAADQIASLSAMEDTVLSLESRREMELQGKWWMVGKAHAVKEYQHTEPDI